MHIAMIHLSGNGFPPDIRIAKEARVLAADGHRVTICTKITPLGRKEFERFEPGIEVLRAHVPPPPSWTQRRKANFTLRESWMKPLVDDFLDRCEPDVAHVHDLPYLPLVLECAKPRGLPVVADLHENMPAAKLAWRSHLAPLRRLKAAVLFNYPLWRWHEKRALHRSERVIVVVPEAAERFAGYGLPRDKVVIVSNTEDETTFQFSREKADPEILSRFKNKWMVSYIGGIGPHRGWDTVLAGTALAAKRIPNFMLTVVGAQAENKAMLRGRADALGISDILEIIPWQPFNKINSYIHASSVCLVPHNDFEHTHTTVPHKLFQYMICQKAILVSDCRPLKRIVEETESGFIFQANDPVDFADKLAFIHANKELARSRAENGFKASLGPYAWRHDAGRLRTLYEELGEATS